MPYNHETTYQTRTEPHFAHEPRSLVQKPALKKRADLKLMRTAKTLK